MEYLNLKYYTEYHYKPSYFYIYVYLQQHFTTK